MNAEKVRIEIFHTAGPLLNDELVLRVLRKCPNIYHSRSDFSRRNVPFEVSL